jgi:enterochelin esterase-like enzyme
MRRPLLLVAALAIATTGSPPPSAADCPDTPHRFERFALPAPALERTKQVLVYLPPGYDCAPGRRYPAFYLNDGHDLFEWNPAGADLDPALALEIARREAWYGSWRLDSQLDQALAARALPPLVVIGIASDDGMRSRDLAPVPWAGSDEARGAAYGEFVARDVVAAAEARYRLMADRRCRGIGGASLGGVSALTIGLAHPATFGLVLAFSPVLGDRRLADYLARLWPRGGAARQVFLIDFDDDPVGLADLARFRALSAAGPAERRTMLLQSPGGRHAIGSWAMRVIPALTRLLPPACLARRLRRRGAARAAGPGPRR